MNVMMLAAGLGSRLSPYTEILPKPAIPFLTVPLAAYSLKFIEPLSYNKLVVNTFHLPEKIHRLFDSLPNPGNADITFSNESGFIRGSGGGLKYAEKHFDADDILLLNADEITLPKNPLIVKDAYQNHKKSNSISTLIVMEHPEVGTKFGGVWVNEKNEVLGFGKTPIPGAHKVYHFIGSQFLKKDILNYIPQNVENNILYEAVMLAMKDGHTARVFPIDCKWFETGNPTDFLNAQSECLKLILENHPEGTYLKEVAQKYGSEKVEYFKYGNSYVAKSASAVLPENLQFEGSISLGANSLVEKNVVLKNVSVAANAVVKAHTHLQDGMILG